MYVGPAQPTKVPAKQDLPDYHARAKARTSVVTQQAANKLLQKHPPLEITKAVRNDGASPRNRQKRRGKTEAASLVSEQSPGDYYQPIKMTRHNFVVEDNRKETANRQDITTVSFGTGGNPSLVGTRDRGSNERVKRRWVTQDPQETHPGTAVEIFDEKRSSGQLNPHAPSSRQDMSQSGGKQSARGVHKIAQSAQFSLKQSKESCRTRRGEDAPKLKQIKHEGGSFSIGPRQQRASDTFQNVVEKRGGLPTMHQNRDSFEDELQLNQAPQTAAPDIRGHTEAIRIAQMNDDLEFDAEGNVIPRHNLGDGKRLAGERASDYDHTSTIHSLFQPSEEVAANLMDQKMASGGAGRPPSNSNGSEHRVKLGPNPQFMITSNSLFSKTSGYYLDDRDKSFQDAKLKQSIDEVTFQLRPAQNFAQTTRAPVLVQRKPPVPAVLPLYLRRTSSALATKFARRFKSNSPVRVHALKAPGHALIPKHAPINARQEQMLLENSLYDSIYTQRAVEKQQKSQRSNSNSSEEKSKSPHNAKQSQFGIARPSYAEPTRKELLPRKELNRQKIAKAIEALRLEQIKHNLVQNQNVTSVCERVLQSTVCQSDKAFEKFRRTNLNQLYALDKSTSTMYRNITSTGFGPHIISNSDCNARVASYQGRSGGKGHSVQPHATLTVNLKFGLNASPAEYLPRLDYWRATKDYPLEEDSLMEEMLEVNNMQEYKDPVVVKSEEDQQSLGDIKNNSSLAAKESPNRGSADGSDGVTPWRSRMTRARNTIEATNTGPSLFDGIKGTSISIHPVTSGDKGSKQSQPKLTTTKSDVTETKNGQQMTFGVDNYQGQTHQTLQQIKSSTIDGQNMRDSQHVSSGAKMDDLNSPVKFGQGQHIKITQKNMAQTPSIEPSTNNEGHYSVLDQQIADQQNKTQLTGHEDSVSQSKEEESDRESDNENIQEHRLKQNTGGSSRQATNAEHTTKVPNPYEQFNADDPERLLYEKQKLMQAMQETANLGQDFIDNPDEIEQPNTATPVMNMPGSLAYKKQSIGRMQRPVVTRQVVPLSLQTFKHDTDATSPLSMGLSGSSPTSKPTILKGLHRISDCTNRAEQNALTTSPSFDIDKYNMVSPPSELNTWPYAIDTNIPSPMAKPGESPRDRKKRGRRSPIPPQDPMSYLHTHPIHLPSDNYYKGSKPLKNTIYNQQAKRHEEKVLTQKDQIDQAKMRQIMNRHQTSSPAVVITDNLQPTPEPVFRDTSDNTLKMLKANNSSTHTIVHPNPEMSPSTLNNAYIQHQKALENGMMNVEYVDAIQMSVRTNTSGTVGEQPEQQGKDLQHLNQARSTPKRIRDPDADRSGKLPQIVPASHPMISADITTTQSRVRMGSTIHKTSPVKRLQRELQGSLMEELVVSGMGQFDKNNTHCHPLQTERQTERFVKQFKGKTPFNRNKPHFANRKKQEKFETESLVMSTAGGMPSLNQTHTSGFKNGPHPSANLGNLIASQNSIVPIKPGSPEAIAASLGSQGSQQPLEMIGQEKHVHTPKRQQVLNNGRNLTQGGSGAVNIYNSLQSAGSKQNSSSKEKQVDSQRATVNVPQTNLNDDKKGEGSGKPVPSNDTQLDSQSLHVSQVSNALVGEAMGQDQIKSSRRPVQIQPEQPGPASVTAIRRGESVVPVELNDEATSSNNKSRILPRRDLSSHQAPRDSNLKRGGLNESFGHLGIPNQEQPADLSKQGVPSVSGVTETDFERSAADGNLNLPPVHGNGYDGKVLQSNKNNNRL